MTGMHISEISVPELGENILLTKLSFLFTKKSPVNLFFSKIPPKVTNVNNNIHDFCKNVNSDVCVSDYCKTVEFYQVHLGGIFEIKRKMHIDLLCRIVIQYRCEKKWKCWFFEFGFSENRTNLFAGCCEF